ncbi:sterol desaturase family protein, partial [Mesorhizobium sp. M2D.F.Ca.ET.145.01.1.1]
MLDDLVGKILDKISGTSLLATGLLLLTAFVSALVAYWRTVEEKSWKEFFEFVIPHEVITHPSAKADLLFWVTKKALMPF